MKVIVNGKSTDDCFSCSTKENTRSVVIPNKFTGTLCIPCIAKRTDAPVEKIQRKKK
jgi:hypothetical protein